MDTRAGRESTQAVLLILKVFTFGFITLISLIAAANVFNTISTNISLRRREFATLRSVGMDRKGFGRMMRFECLLYGLKALALGLPVSILVTWLVYKSVNSAFVTKFRIPWVSMGIASASVFLVVGVTMVYAMGKIRRENIVETLRNENI
jgi:putative ABC transport system permease protein